MARNDNGPPLPWTGRGYCSPAWPEASRDDREHTVRWLLRRADLLDQLLKLGTREPPALAGVGPE
ncbi:hypothetical protein ACFQLX_12830 [Streptomyces polyrhachis]|uniref:Uncharacterized protein n=1 Tax=Streptomyces polyrhachis TaxID=1282885 RepID=A0ABW2GJL3_9ACTN